VNMMQGLHKHINRIKASGIDLYQGDTKIGMIESLTSDKESFTTRRVAVFHLPLVVGEILTLVFHGRRHLVRVVHSYESYDLGQDFTIYNEQKFTKLCACEEELTEGHLKKCLVYQVKGPYV